MLHVFHCIPILQWDIWSLEFQNQVLSLLRNLPSWQFPRCGPVWKGVKLTMVVYDTTSTAHSMEPVSLCCPHELFRKKYPKTVPLMKKYGGDKVQGVADVEKLCSSLLPTAPSQRAAKLRSRHQCRCMIWSSNHVMATNFQTGWTWMNPSYNPGHSLSYELMMNIQSQASGQRKHQIAGLFDAACPLQIAGTSHVHLPLQGQTRTSSLEIMISLLETVKSKFQKWNAKVAKVTLSLPIVSLLFPLSSMSKETIVWKLHNCRRLPSRPWWWKGLKPRQEWLSDLAAPAEIWQILAFTFDKSIRAW